MVEFGKRLVRCCFPCDCVAGTCAIEVKNYDLSSPGGQSSLINTTSNQLNYRNEHLPDGMTQEVRIDITGQNVPRSQRDEIAQQISDRTGGIVEPEDIQFFSQP